MIQKVSYNHYSPQSRPVSNSQNITFGSFSHEEIQVAKGISNALTDLTRKTIAPNSDGKIIPILFEVHENISGILKKNKGVDLSKVADILDCLAKTLRKS